MESQEASIVSSPTVTSALDISNLPPSNTTFEVLAKILRDRFDNSSRPVKSGSTHGAKRKLDPSRITPNNGCPNWGSEIDPEVLQQSKEIGLKLKEKCTQEGPNLTFEIEKQMCFYGIGIRETQLIKMPQLKTSSTNGRI